MSQSPTTIALMCLFFIAALLTTSFAVMPSSATTLLQLEPTTASSGDRILATFNVAKNGSTVGVSYYYDANKNGKDDDGSSWVKIGNVTDGGSGDANNATNGIIYFPWMTPQLAAGQYLFKVEDPNGPTRTTPFTVVNSPLHLAPAVYGPSSKSDKGKVVPGSSFSVIAHPTGNCRLCHVSDNPTRDNPGVNITTTSNLFSADLSQITGYAGDTNVPPSAIHHLEVDWYGLNAGKTLADNQTVSATVTGTNPAGNFITQSVAYAGVNTAVNIPPKETSSGKPLGTGLAQSNTTGQSAGQGQSNPLPGFEVVFAISGLTAAAYLMSRKR
ncbi:MAG: PGF-CTERM sorting domain-containing protein [Halobacteriota archaeon]